MRHGNFEPQQGGSLNWRLLAHIWPFLKESRIRVGVALACLLMAKAAILAIPFLLKHLVDNLGLDTVAATAPVLLLGLVLAYGAARFANVFFGELRDTVFGRVTERAMRRIGLKVFQHVHSLDLEYHLNRHARASARQRDVEPLQAR